MAEKKKPTKEKAETAVVETKKAPVQKLDLTKVTVEQIQNMRNEYADLQLMIKMGKETNGAKLRLLRRNIARALTAIRLNNINEQSK